MKVWRVQNEAGYGPYQGGSEEWSTKDHSSCCRTPVPGRDKVGDASLRSYLIEDHLFGFTSLNCLRKWFSLKELRNLFRKDFYVVQLQADSVIPTKKQCIFIPSYPRPYSAFMRISSIKTLLTLQQQENIILS